MDSLRRAFGSRDYALFRANEIIATVVPVDDASSLVRVEAADSAVTSERPEDLTLRADLISRWILAEVAPLALPDGRWDKMVYGIRDCEEFLRAVC